MKRVISHFLVFIITLAVTYVCTTESQSKVMGLNAIQNHSFLSNKFEENAVTPDVKKLVHEQLACTVKQYINLKENLLIMRGKGPLEDMIMNEAINIIDGEKCPWMTPNK